MQTLPIFHCGIHGFGDVSADYAQRSLSIDELLIQHPSATFIGKIDGEELVSLGILKGALVIVDKQLSPKHGDLVVFNYDGEYQCRVLNVRRKILVVKDENITPIAIGEDGVEIIGVVSASINCFKPVNLNI